MSGRHLPPERFATNAREALRDDGLRGALRHLATTFGERRAAAVAEVGEADWNALRAHARAIKDATLARLDHYLEQFVARTTARGVVVHWARDGVEACDKVAALVAAAGARTVVKSKSMTTEEIRLEDRLAAGGVESIETDLGEFIVQLAGEVPSHIVVPAIHRTRARIAALFHERLGIAEDADVESLTAAARAVLREAFARADVGISGVNFAVAETGTFLILENEGNARLSTSLPRVHVAVMGIEKLIPRLADLEVFLQLLPRSGTGQRLTTYQTLITGPKQDPHDEGPDEVHLVLLDNGRSRLLARDVTRQTLACIRCGACLNACPVYQSVGGHAYGSVYPGPIGAVLTPQLIGIGKAAELPYASTLCGACREVCPVAIDIPELLLHLRAETREGSDPIGPPLVEQRGPRRRRERLAFGLWAWVVRGRRRYEIAAALARLVPGVLQRRIAVLRAWTAGRDLRPLARRSFRAGWRRGTGE